MSTPSGAYKIWRHPHLKLVDKCLQYVVWLAMRLDKLDSVAKLAGPEGAKARRRMVQFNAGAAARFAAKHWTTMVETTPEGVELIVYSPKHVDSPVPVVLWIHGGGYQEGVRGVTFSFLCPLLEKYGTFIARCNALIEKVSPCIGNADAL